MDKTYELNQDDVVIIDCKKPYSHSTQNNLWTLQWCHFYGPNMPAIYAKYCERGGEPVIHPADVEPYKNLMTELYKTAESDDYIRDMRINEKLNVLMTLLMESSWNQESRVIRTKTDIQEIKSYLDENYKEKITLDSTAKHFFINKHYLARRFKEQYGVTLTIYLQQVRITHAKRMLRFTDKSVEEIGLECGIGELPYFSRVFKKLEGVSPSEY
ncbi:MAG: helix-turn-helix transcriptional regulator, partial [Coprococcus sp.]